MCCKQREENIVAKDLSFVHPELRQMAKMFPRLPFRRWNLRLIRWLSRLQPKAKRPDDIQVDDVWIQSQDLGHKIRLRVYKPRKIVMPAPVLVWMHGGVRQERCQQFRREAQKDGEKQRT
jgi:acetyl esterase/lipase